MKSTNKPKDMPKGGKGSDTSSDEELLRNMIQGQYQPSSDIPGDDMKQLVTSRDLQYHYRDMCTVSISTIADVLQKLGYEFTFVDGIPYWVMYARIE